MHAMEYGLLGGLVIIDACRGHGIVTPLGIGLYLPTEQGGMGSDG